MASGKPQEPEDVVREALDRLTAAVLTLTAETLRAHSGSTSGDVPDSVRRMVLDVHSKILSEL